MYAQSSHNKTLEIRIMYAAVNEPLKSGRSYDCKKGNARNKAECMSSKKVDGLVVEGFVV